MVFDRSGLEGRFDLFNGKEVEQPGEWNEIMVLDVGSSSRTDFLLETMNSLELRHRGCDIPNIRT